MGVEVRGTTALSIVDQQIVIQGDVGSAVPATIVIPNHAYLQVRVDGEPVTGHVEVYPQTRVEIEYKDEPPVRQAVVSVSTDGMEATLEITLKSGRRFFLPDREPTALLDLVIVEEEWPAQPYQLDEVQSLLADQKIVYNVQMDAIQALLATRQSGCCVCAIGKPVTEGVPEHYEMLVKEPAETRIIGVIPLRPILTVRAGTALARRVPAVQGVSGIDVFGNARHPAQLRSQLPRLGKGVVAQDDVLYAARGGRVVQLPRLLDVAEEFEIDGSLSAVDGHVEFDGDVLIRGDVNEGVQIVAGGQVVVAGSVQGAMISGEAGIIISGSAFQAHLCAGTRIRSLRELADLLRQLIDDLDAFQRAVQQLNQALSHRSAKVDLGRVTAALLTDKFAHVPTWRPRLYEWVNMHHSVIGAAWREWIEQLADNFQLERMQAVTDVKEWLALKQRITAKFDAIPDEAEQDVDLQVKGAQNTKLECTGNVIVTGQGLYQCQIQAGNTVRALGVPGALTSCDITAGRSVEAREIGSPAETEIRITITSSEGYVKAGLIHAGASLSIGAFHHRVMREMRDCTWP